jgi:ankyrin repeat protein
MLRRSLLPALGTFFEYHDEGPPDEQLLRQTLASMGRGFYLTWRTPTYSGTMLHWVVEKYLSEVHMRVLLDGGIAVNEVDDYGNTALHQLCAHRRDGNRTQGDVGLMIQTLIDGNADINATNRQGNTPIMQAAMGGRVCTTALDKLLSLQPDITKKSQFNATLLHLVAPTGSAKVIQEIIDMKQVDIDAQNRWLSTALFVSNPASMKTLLQNGANMSIQNGRGDDVLASLRRIVADNFAVPAFDELIVIWNDELQRRRYPTHCYSLSPLPRPSPNQHIPPTPRYAMS